MECEFGENCLFSNCPAHEPCEDCGCDLCRCGCDCDFCGGDYPYGGLDEL